MDILYSLCLLLDKQQMDCSLVEVTRGQGASPHILLQCSTYLADTKAHAGIYEEIQTMYYLI